MRLNFWQCFVTPSFPNFCQKFISFHFFWHGVDLPPPPIWAMSLNILFFLDVTPYLHKRWHLSIMHSSVQSIQLSWLNWDYTSFNFYRVSQIKWDWVYAQKLGNQVWDFHIVFFLLINWDPYANFKYKTISVQFKGAKIYTKQNGVCGRSDCIELAFFYFPLSGILKDDKNKHKLKLIYPVATTYGISGYLGGFQCQSGAIQRPVS